MKFKVGDRVRCIKGFDGVNLAGKTGTVVELCGDDRVGVDFDDAFFMGHECAGTARNGHGRYGYNNQLELLTDIDEPHVEKVDKPVEKKEKLNLPSEFAYIARDKDGLLFAYVNKPKRDVGGTQWYGEQFKKIDDSLLPYLKWTDEPYEV